jgi:hypothetical protein
MNDLEIFTADEHRPPPIPEKNRPVRPVSIQTRAHATARSRAH